MQEQKVENEDAMTTANIMPSSPLNIPKNGRGEKAFFNYKKNQKTFKQKVPKFKDYLKAKAY